jgi:hypothetical protein
MTDPVESPLLFLDVDGPLLPFGDGPQRWPSGDVSTSHLARLDPQVGHRLAALPRQLVWATDWEEGANAGIAARIGLPRQPVVIWPGSSYEHEPSTTISGSGFTGRPALWWRGRTPVRLGRRDHRRRSGLGVHIPAAIGEVSKIDWCEGNEGASVRA